MKTPFLLLLLSAIWISCAPTPDEPNRPENELIHSPQSQILDPAKPNRTVQSTLVCGCGFVLRIDGRGGSDAITYSVPTAASGDTLQTHDIIVTANTTGLAKGTYTSWLALSTPDPFEGALRDTIYDTLEIP